MSFSIGIIGGGVTGLSALHRLVTLIVADSSLFRKCKEVHLWEENDHVGGPAWSADNSDVQLFNFPAGVAALELHDYSGAFLRWCAAEGHEGLHFGSYPPRHLFGAYCTHFLQATQAMASEKGVTLMIHSSARVTNVHRTGDDQSKMCISWTDTSHCDSEVVVNAALLCTGPAAKENDILSHLRGCESYFSSPWPHPRIPPHATVAVVGTGLSAVDAVKQLMECGHKGPVVMASRRGLLPTIKPLAFDPFVPLSVATPEAVEAMTEKFGRESDGLLLKFIELIKQEMIAFQNSAPTEKAECNEDFDTCFREALSDEPRNGLAELKQNLAICKKGKRLPWQDCIIALGLKDVVRSMWNVLGAADRSLYEQRYSTLLSIYFNSMPISSGEDMLRYFESGRCALKRGLREVTFAESGGFELIFDDSSAPAQVDFVINAAGFGKHFSKIAPVSTLHRALLEGQDLVQAYDRGGLVCEYSTGRLKGVECSDGEGSGDRVCALLYGAGHLISGTKLLTSGVSYCLQDGAAAVHDMLGQLKAEIE